MTTRKPLIGGNWKCNGTVESCTKLIDAFNKANVTDKTDVVIASPFVHLHLLKEKLRKDFQIAAQNCYHKNGAFTGEVSADMLKDLDIPWVILGHSERRHIFGESDELIAEKTKAALNAGLKVIGCIGEKLEERESGKTTEVCFRQMKAFASAVTNWDNFVIAYEPVWAIGTGKVATPTQAQEVHSAIRKWLEENVSKEVAEKVRILYGGSVKPENANELFAEKDIDGFLVGGASLKPDFDKIINSVTTPKKH